MVLVGVSMCQGDLTSASILSAITRPPDGQPGQTETDVNN